MTYTNEYEQKQAELVDALIETMAFTDGETPTTYANPFYTYRQRLDAFELFLEGPMGLPSCGCGDPESTLTAFVEALDVCALKNSDPARDALMLEKFGVKHPTEDRLVQLVFYVLDAQRYIEHNYSIGGSYLTKAGKLMRVMLKRYLEIEEPTVEQISEGDFELDVEAIISD